MIKPELHADFILKLTDAELFSLCIAADYLMIAPLLDLCCAQLSRKLVNKLPYEALQLIGTVPHTHSLEGILSAEEEEQLERMIQWTCV